MENFRINANLLRCASLFVSTEATRHHLSGVHIEPHPVSGAILVATEGHMLCALHDATGCAPHPITVSANWKAPALKVGRREMGRCVSFAANALTDSASAIAEVFNYSPETGETYPDAAPVDSLVLNRMDDVFPDWRRLIPLHPLSTDEIGTVSAGYLATVNRAAELLVSCPTFTFFAAGPMNPVVIRIGGVSSAFFMLMPVRRFSAGGATPEWLTATPGDAAASEG